MFLFILISKIFNFIFWRGEREGAGKNGAERERERETERERQRISSRLHA